MASPTVTVGYTNNSSQGTQTDVSELDVTGNNYLGIVPFQVNTVVNPNAILSSLPFSTTGAKQTIAVPVGACGILIQPNVATTGTLLYAQNGTDIGSYISPIAPSRIYWDPNNIPANVYLTGSVVTTNNLIKWL